MFWLDTSKKTFFFNYYITQPIDDFLILIKKRATDATGSVLVNGRPRDIRVFRKMSRYIMQQDLYQPMLTIREAMKIAADLKLGHDLCDDKKNELVMRALCAILVISNELIYLFF